MRIYLLFMLFTFHHVKSIHVNSKNNDLIKIRKRFGSDGNEPACCGDSLTCDSVDIVPELLGKQNISLPGCGLPGGIKLSFVGHVDGNVDNYHYAGEQGDLLLKFNPKKSMLHGHVMTSSGRSFVLEFCGTDGHVWKEHDVENFKDNDPLPDVVKDIDTTSILESEIEQDNTTMVTYSVKFYYTPEFAAVVSDIEEFTDQIILETNEGYINSKIPLRVVKHCTEEATIHENYSSRILDMFTNMKSSPKELRGTADVATLLVNRMDSCGWAWGDTLWSGKTMSVIRRDCAISYYSFGHEVGHNVGLYHNIDVDFNAKYPYAHGHLIEKDSNIRGSYTILAYPTWGYTKRVNYYSNPDVVYPETGTVTGVSGQSNNAALLIRNRKALSQIGDESLACAQRNTN